MDLIEEKYKKLDLLIEAIGDAESLQDTAAVAVELYKTLGFCHGFLGKGITNMPDADSPEFPWDSKVLMDCDNGYLAEFYVGKSLKERMEGK